jgi:hypothetical protein
MPDLALHLRLLSWGMRGEGVEPLASAGGHAKQPNACAITVLMKVDKTKFDDLLGRLIKAKPLPEKKVKAPKKRSPRPILDKPQKG